MKERSGFWWIAFSTNTLPPKAIRPITNLPARLNDTGQHSAQCLLAETDAAQTKSTHVAARASTHLAAIAHLYCIFSSCLTHHHGCLRHVRSSPCLRIDHKSALERHIHQRQHATSLFISFCRCDNRQLHATHFVNFVVIDLRKNQLLAQTNAVVATAIE